VNPAIEQETRKYFLVRVIVTKNRKWGKVAIYNSLVLFSSFFGINSFIYTVTDLFFGEPLP
jgi:hypothetical protein